MEWKNKGKLKKNPKLHRLQVRERAGSADLPTFFNQNSRKLSIEGQVNLKKVKWKGPTLSKIINKENERRKKRRLSLNSCNNGAMLDPEEKMKGKEW
jgi:hypothetical protein